MSDTRSYDDWRPSMSSGMPVAISMPREPERARSCGPCTLCCKVLAIDEKELKKPKDRWCEHAAKGCGCRIHEQKPAMCKEFRCLWLQGHFREDQRPDRLHGVPIPTTDGKNWVLIEDPGYRGVARERVRGQIERWIAGDRERYVVVVVGGARSFYGDVETFRRLRSAGAIDVALTEQEEFR